MTESQGRRAPQAGLAAAILAGGSGRRLSSDKPLLDVGGIVLIERVIAALRSVDLEPIIITNAPEDLAHLGLRMARDIRPGLGPLGGILTALHEAEADRVLVVAADLPFLQPALLALLISRVGEADCAVTEWNGRPQPLHGIYSRSCAAPIEAMIEAGELRPIHLYPKVATVVVPEADVAAADPQGLSFFNINTPEELQEARRMAAEMGLQSEVGGDLVRRTPLGAPVVGIAGRSKSGKTTLIEALVHRLSARGLQVAVLKHSGSGLMLDEAGRDTDRIYNAGATVVLARDSQQAFTRRRDPDSDWQAALATAPADIDVLLVEGYKRAPIPRLWVGDSADEFGDVPGIVTCIADPDAGMDEADAVVAGLIDEAWASRPWGTVTLGDAVLSARLAEDPDTLHPLSPVPGMDPATGALLAAMRWLPDRTWIAVPDAEAEALRRRRRPGVWSLSEESPPGSLTLVEPAFRPQLERQVLGGARLSSMGDPPP